MLDNDQRTTFTYAKIAGLGYLIIIISGIFAQFVVREDLIVSGDATATAANIVESESLFRIAMASDIVMLVFDVIVALALFVIFRAVSLNLAWLATFFRLLHAAVYSAAVLALFIVVSLVSDEGYGGLAQGQADALVLLFTQVHAYGYVLALTFFGVHVLLLSYLVLRSAYLPKAIGVLLFFAGGGYLVDSFANVLLVNYSDYETLFGFIVFVPAVIGELSLALWLLIKGIDDGSFRDRMIASPSMQLDAGG